MFVEYRLQNIFYYESKATLSGGKLPVAVGRALYKQKDCAVIILYKKQTI